MQKSHEAGPLIEVAGHGGEPGGPPKFRGCCEWYFFFPQTIRGR